ncbi:MAG: sugar ABC transporter ATP-binding protein [Bacteroidota bacterium]
MSEFVLEMKRIRKQFDGNFVLNGADFDLYPGEVHALVGENGAGKSTLMNILAGIYPKDGGEILLEGKPVEIENARFAQKLGIGSIFQNYSLFYDMNVAQNIFLNQEPTLKFGFLKLINWKLIYKRTKEILDYLNIHIDPKMPVGVLSAGTQKFIEIARTFVNRSRIIIMDEPTAALTEQEIDFLFGMIHNLTSVGVSIIYISHRLDELRFIADRITVMRDGKTVATINKGEYDSNRLVKMIVGDEIKDRYPKLKVALGKEVLIVKDLSNGKLLQNISFTLRKGEILGIAGLKGSGKTLLAKTLFGAEPILTGNIYIKGKKIKLKNTHDAAANGLCYIPHNRMAEGLAFEASVADNIVITNLEGIVKHKCLSSKLKRLESGKYIKMVGIKLNTAEEKIKNLSGGNQKKTILAKWLYKNARILILNEPTSGIDISSKVDVYNILNELVMSGASLIMVSSEIQELLGMCDRILVMYHGKIVKELQRCEATQAQILYYASGCP